MFIRRALLVILLTAVTMPTAFAHGMLKRTSPRADSVVHTAPPQVRLSFSERIEPAFSTIEVRNTAGEKVDSGKPQVDPQDKMALQVALPPLPPGRYSVTWRAVSVDTHSTSGTFTFEIAPE